MSNVVNFHGAMHPSKALRIGSMSETEQDAQIAENRARFEEACEAAELGIVSRSTRMQPSLIPLDNSLLARAARWLRGLQPEGTAHMIPRTISIAPRGKVFRLVRMNHVVGGKVLPVLMPGRFLTRTDADKAATQVDERLSPAVVLVDDIKVEEDRE